MRALLIVASLAFSVVGIRDSVVGSSRVPSAESRQPTIAKPHVLLIVGASGEPQYATAFNDAAARIVDAATSKLGIAPNEVVWLAEDSTRSTKISGRSTKENVQRAVQSIALRSAPNDPIWIVLIGHGSSEEAPRFNLPGPDITASDFATLLALFPTQPIAFVDATSASADFVRALAGTRRAIVTATTSPSERNVTRFARYFADALSTGNADLDKDGGVSLLEAFTYAKRETARSYETENRMQTEHPQLDDDGDGKATANPATDAADGRLAASLVLGGVPASADPRLGPLVAKRRALELQVADLRRQRASIDSAAYWARMESTLVELARTAHAIRGMGGLP